ncbi:MAG: PIN domain-containing protein, partial [Pseudomonadota bacterium]
VQYAKAEAFFENVRVGKEKAVIMESVLVECVYILMKFYKVPKRETADVLTVLLQYKGIANVDRKTLVEALRIFAEQNLDIVDCILLARTKQGKGRLFSFDRALNKLHEK